MMPQVRIPDDEDEAEEAMRGIIRNVVPDSKWEDKLDADMQKLASMFASFPSALSTKMFIQTLAGVLVFLVCGLALGLCGFFMCAAHDSLAPSIFLSGLRPTILSMIHYFLLRMTHDNTAALTYISNVDYPKSTNPVWRNSSHFTTDRQQMMDYIFSLMSYYDRIHSSVHYGAENSQDTGDRIVDLVKASHADIDLNTKMLFEEKDCYLEHEYMCNLPEYQNRLFHIDKKILGMSSLISRFKFYVHEINRLNMNDSPCPLNVTSDYYLYLHTALSFDMRDGNLHISTELEDSGVATVQTTMDTITIITCCVCVLVFLSYMCVITPLRNGLLKESNYTKKLKELLPTDEDEKEMVMLPSMVTHIKKWDVERRRIINSAQAVIQALKDKESSSVIVSLMQHLIQMCLKQFTEEEKEMAQAGYSEFKEHSADHILLRQRLTIIMDQIVTSNAAAQMSAKRALIRIFDKHFTDDDIKYAQTQVDFSAGQNKTDENNENNENNEMDGMSDGGEQLDEPDLRL